MSDCDKKNINCPPRYKNIGSANFGDGKKVTAELLYQYCQNDSYLYDQVKKLWDKTDPEHRKRFYAPYYMDSSKSYGVEPLVYDDENKTFNNKVSINDINNKLTKPNGKVESAYHLSNTLRERYLVDFDYTNDKTYWELNSNGEYDTLRIDNDSIIEDSSTLNVIGEEKNGILTHTVLPQTSNTTVSGEIPFTLYKTTTVDNKKVVKEKKVTKKDVYGKLSLDAYCDGPYHNWHSNSVWYIGYNRHKNYNVKNAWRKNPDTNDIPSVCRGQTFKAKTGGELRKVVLLMKGSSKSVSPCIVEIRTVKNGKPTQKVLARTEQKFNHSSKTLVNFTFKKPCIVKKGTTYAIVIRSPLSNFNHCYWLGGWAHTCFSNNRKRAYYDGETFLSEDNGKTWITHGKKEKCYGSHYYDWGFAEAPVNFGFEVYIAPKTGTKTETNYVPKTVNGQVTSTVKVTDYKSASIDLCYYEAGTYYLEFKPFSGNFYTDVTCIAETDSYEEGTNIGEYSWEIFNNDIDELTGKMYGWQSFTNYATLYGTLDSNSSYSIRFNKALTFVKLRLKFVLEDNVLKDDGEENFMSRFQTIVSELIQTQGIIESEVMSWIRNVESYFGWKNVDETPLNIRTLKNVEFIFSKKPSFKGYLRTLEYHPVQEGMLPACIWSELDADIIPKNKGNVLIDVVHERTAIEHMLFYKPTNTALQEYIINYEKDVLGIDTNDNISYSSEDILSYCVNIDDDGEDDVINTGFIGYLQTQNPKVYILPYRVTETIVNEDTNEEEEIFKRYIYFFGKTTADVSLNDYPAYPINSCSMISEDYHLNIKEQITNGNIAKESSTSMTYTHSSDLTDKVKDIQVSYKYTNPDTQETVTEFVQLALNDDYTINGNIITFKVTESNRMYDYVAIDDAVTVKANDYLLVDETEIIIETISYEYTEFQNYLVDYDSKVFHFYEPLALVEGEMSINYNPLWVRGLTVDDFPLKMDLWTEYYQVIDGGKDEKDNTVFLFEKCKLNECGKPVIEEHIENAIGKPYIVTSVPPLDNIREIDIQDYNLNSTLTEPLVEDEDYTVDYLTNQISFTYNGLHTDSIVMVKYTPNLTDNGLSLGYRLSRPLYDAYDNELLETVFVDKTSRVNSDIEDGDDVFCLSNYFTTRT